MRKPRAPGSGFAKRCALGGDPISGECSILRGGFAIARDGVVHVVADQEIRRYKVADGDDCHLEPAGAALALPPEKPRMQKVDGPLYMRSGGPDWRIAAAGSALYAYDFLAGLYRIDRGKAEPACTDVFGYSSLASLGGKLLIARKGIEKLAPGAKCTARDAGIDAKARGDIYVIRDRVYAASRGGSAITRYDGTTATTIGEGTRICSVSALVACGDGTCVIDHNCMQVIQLDADGKPLRTIEDDKLFDTRPYSLSAAATAADGSVFVLARHRDKVGDREICELAVYRLPSAVFAL